MSNFQSYLLFGQTFLIFENYKIFFLGERSGSVVECLTLDQGATGSSLTGVTVLSH